MPLQNGIIASVTLISTLTAGATKREAENILVELRKSEESMRDRLFVLQVWRKYDQETADKLARRKAGEYLDPELAKVLEEREKKMHREKRERERDRKIFGNRSKRYRSDSSYRGDSRPSTSDHGTYHTGGRGSFRYGYGGGGHGGSYGGHGGGGSYDGGRGGKRPGPEQKFHLCGDPGHFFKQCPTKSNHYDANIELNFTKNKMFVYETHTQFCFQIFL